MARVLSELVHHLGRVVVRDALAHLSDAELLQRFTTEREALAVLVRRHGVMVLGVCERVAGCGADADDAFQATFLTLVRSAHAIRSESIAGWLYRVARRVGIRARRERVKRLAREQRVARAESMTSDEAERSDWRSFLDREVAQLPAQFRDAFVLCHLEGRSHEDAARELGCPLGTLHSRLARAKERLRGRLAAFGVALPVISPTAVSARRVSEAVDAAIGMANGSSVATVTRAVALSQGVWKPMVILKTKVVVGILLAAVGSGIGLTNLQTATATTTSTQARAFATAKVASADPTMEELKRENERLRREVTDLKKKLEVAETKLAPQLDDVPTDAEIIQALPKPAADAARDNIIIVKDKIVDRLDPPRDFPTIGKARLWHRHWECKVYYMESTELPGGGVVKKPRVHVVYIDKYKLVLDPSDSK